MNTDMSNMLRKASRHHMHTIWEHAKENDLDNLDEEERQLARIMLEHEDEFFNQFEFSDVLDDYSYDPETEVNPFLHIIVHSAIENQLRAKDPIEANQFYNSMRKKKVTHHDTIHIIGSIFLPLLFHTLKQKTEFDVALYQHLLKLYKDKKPEKISFALDRDLGFLFSE